VANRAIALCGLHRTPWSNIAKVAYLLQHTSWFGVQLQLYHVVGRRLNLDKVTEIRDLQLLYWLAVLEKISWDEVIIRTQDFNATDPRDKIIALLGLRLPAGQTREFLIQPDYSMSEAAIYRIATLAIISAFSLRSTFVGTRFQHPCQRGVSPWGAHRSSSRQFQSFRRFHSTRNLAERGQS
jgi:hypothetical protein